MTVKQPRSFLSIFLLMAGAGLIFLLLLSLPAIISGNYSTFMLQTLLVMALLVALMLLPIAYMFRGIRVEARYQDAEAFLASLEDQLARMGYRRTQQRDDFYVYSASKGARAVVDIMVQLAAGTATIVGPAVRVNKLQKELQLPPDQGTPAAWPTEANAKATPGMPEPESSRRNRFGNPIAVSFIAALVVNVLVILALDWLLYVGQLGLDYLILCLPASIVILALAGAAGAWLARAFGGNPTRGATIGIWVGAFSAIALSILGLVGIGPGV